jgi:hypothetical protein
MDHANWITFNELCLTLRITPYQAIRLIKADKVKYIAWGRSYRTQHRFIDPGDDALLHMEATGTIEFDLSAFPFISAAEFAEIAGVSQNRIRRLVLLGHVKPKKMGGVNVFTPKQVRNILLKRERRTPLDRKPLVRDIVRWFLQYYEQEYRHSLSQAQVREDDELERQLNRMMKLPHAQRSRTMRQFWQRVELARKVADAINEKGSDGGKAI